MSGYHSPTPWLVEKNLYGTANIIVTEGRQIAACAAESPSADLDADAKQDEANAAYIVRCVNAHEKLVALVQRMMMSVKYHRAATGDYETLGKLICDAKSALEEERELEGADA